MCKIRVFIFTSVPKAVLLGERGLRYIVSCTPSPVLTELLQTMFKQTDLSRDCSVCARLMVTGKTEEV